MFGIDLKEQLTRAAIPMLRNMMQENGSKSIVAVMGDTGEFLTETYADDVVKYLATANERFLALKERIETLEQEKKELKQQLELYIKKTDNERI